MFNIQNSASYTYKSNFIHKGKDVDGMFFFKAATLQRKLAARHVQNDVQGERWKPAVHCHKNTQCSQVYKSPQKCREQFYILYHNAHSKAEIRNVPLCLLYNKKKKKSNFMQTLERKALSQQHTASSVKNKLCTSQVITGCTYSCIEIYCRAFSVYSASYKNNEDVLPRESCA